MSSDDRIIELLSIVIDELRDSNKRLSNLENEAKITNSRLESLENESKITNQRLGALEYAFLNDSRELRTRVERLEATVAKLNNAA